MPKDRNVDPADCRDCDSPLGHPCPHDPWGADTGGAILWLSLGIVLIGGLLWLIFG